MWQNLISEQQLTILKLLCLTNRNVYKLGMQYVAMIPNCQYVVWINHTYLFTQYFGTNTFINADPIIVSRTTSSGVSNICSQCNNPTGDYLCLCYVCPCPDSSTCCVIFYVDFRGLDPDSYAAPHDLYQGFCLCPFFKISPNNDKQ